MVAATRPAEQRLYEQLGAAGKMAPVRGDFLGVITQNAGGNKLDAYLHRRIDYRVAVDPASGRISGRLRITLRNDAPRELPPAVLGTDYFPNLPPGANRLYLSVYTPWQLVSSSLDGTPVTLESANELGRQVYSGAVVVPAGGIVTVDLTLSGHLSSSARYRLDIHRQPTAAPDRVALTLEVPEGWAASGGARRWDHDQELDGDRSIELRLQRR